MRSRCSTARSPTPTARPMPSAIRCWIRRTDARARRARLPVGAARPRRAARPAGHGPRGRQRAVPRLRRLHRPPRARARRRPARRLARCRRRDRSQGRAEPAAARPLHRERRFLAQRDARARALFQDGQPRLSRLGAQDGLPRPCRADRAAAVFGNAAEVPPRRAGPRRNTSRRRSIASASRPISIRCRSGTSRSKARRSTISTRRSRSAR